MASSPPAVAPLTVGNQPANTIPKALRKLKLEMQGMAMSLCELTSDNIDADKALTLINCCYYCPGSINNRIRREYFCYSKLAWKTRTASKLMHDYIKPFLMAKYSGTVEEFQSEFVTKCRNCGAEGFGRLWRGEKCYCSSQCSSVAGANKRSCQRDIKNRLVAEDHVQINRACSQHAALLEDITSSEDELIVFDDEMRLSSAVPDRICPQSRRNSCERVQAELRIPENIRNAATPLFDVSDSDDELNTSETAAQFICTEARATIPHFVERQPSVDFIREYRSSVVKVEPQSFVPELSAAVTIHQLLSQTPMRGSDERERLQPHSSTNEANTAAASATEFVPAPRIRPHFRFLSINTVTTIKQELLESRAQERSQSRTAAEQVQHAQIDNRASASDVSDDPFVDGFEQPICGQSTKSMLANFERANSSSDRTDVKDSTDNTSQRFSVSCSNAVDKAFDNYMDSIEAGLWKTGPGLSMKSNFETDASLKKRAKRDSLSD